MLASDELERIDEEAVVAHFMVLSQYSVTGTEDSHD